MSAPWVNDESLDVLVLLAQQAPAAFDAFMEYVGNGQDRGEEANHLVHEYEFLAFIDENAALRVLEMPFMEYVTFYESVLLRDLAEFITLDRHSLDRLLSHPVLEGGIEDEDVPYLPVLLALEEDAFEVLDMPFLQDLDDLDIRALLGLNALKQAKGEEFFRRVLSRFGLRGGITDETTSILAAVISVVRHNRLDLIDVLLDPEQTHVEIRKIDAPLAGQVRLYVIRPGVEASQMLRSETMDLLEQAVRSQEEFMRVAFPYSSVIALVADIHRFGGTGGGGIVITKYSEHRGVIAHEVGHSYWSGTASWISEGGASFLDVISHRAYDGTPLPTSELPCHLFNNLAELEQSSSTWEEVYDSGCNYSLGRGLFRELYSRIGDEAFRLGFGNLYSALRDSTHKDVCGEVIEGMDVYACYVHESFTGGALLEHVDIVNDVLARRYYGTSQ